MKIDFHTKSKNPLAIPQKICYTENRLTVRLHRKQPQEDTMAKKNRNHLANL